MSKYQTFKNRIAAKVLQAGFIESHVQERLVRAYPGIYRMGEFQENDVFLVGYPKSGNTWLQNLVTGLMYGVYGDNVRGSLVQELVPGVHYKTCYQRFNEITCFKSHFLPRKEYRRVIYIARDGRDALVSLWHYHKALTGEELDFEEMVELPINKFGTWSEHIMAWTDNPYDADFLILKYEDLLEDGSVQLKRICGFLGLNKSDEEINRVIEANQFTSLKEKENKFGFGHGQKNWKTDKPFFRRGEMESFKDEMPPEAIVKFNDIHMEAMKKLAYL